MISYDDIKSGRAAVPAEAGDHGLALDVIQIDGGTQSRATLNDQVVSEYAEAIKVGAAFPPIVVFYDGKKHWLADGFHRFHAYQKAGKSKVAADVRQGTRRDAILHSVGANEAHGLRRTNDDKRRAVLTLLNDKEWSKWSDGEIAKRCAVSREYVNRLRPTVTCDQVTSERTYTTKHGTTATMKTAGINASRKNAPEGPQLDDEPYPEAGPQAEASPAGIGSGTPADREGRRDGEAASVGLPTISDAEREADAIQSPFDRASDEGRALFLARNNLKSSDGEGPIEAAGSEQPSADHVSPPVRNRDEGIGSANTGGGYVTPTESEQVTTTAPNEEQTSLAAREGEEVAALNPNPRASSSRQADKAEASTSSPSASATPFSNPRCKHPDTCSHAHLKTSCHDCFLAWAQRPPEEQRRLWTEAEAGA